MSDKILCVNANAAIDKTLVIKNYRLDAIHRPERVMSLPGGKGCNAARALKRIGGTPVVTGWVGGFAGQWIETNLQREGIATRFVQTSFESRECISVLDPDQHTLTEIYERGDAVPFAQVDEFRELVRASIHEFSAMTLSGSLPPGVPRDFYADLIELAHAANVPVILDSSGEFLRHGVAHKPALVKPNRAEVQEWLGRVLRTRDEFAHAARGLAARYETRIVISLGAEGALAADEKNVWYARPPELEIVSAVGSGDSMLGGMAYALTHGLSFEEILRYGIAAGTANALTLGAGVFARADFETILRAVHVTSFVPVD
jgi:1-phosphofructokinase family hexose kinase